ncbi:MAG: hypothetical protein PVI30_04915 [Myxococcales bacterium]|jgi:hypothetical protein
MNFFGHACVARRVDDDPRHLLGAMLPDLATMAGVRLAGAQDAAIARGVAHHHEVDRAFHRLAPFVALCRSALEQLTEAGVSRASARAVGHVGAELLLDGLLAEDAQARADYRASLRHALRHGLAGRVGFREDGGATGLQRVLSRLADAPIPEGYREPAFVADRLTWILARRPRLALQPADDAPVRAWLRQARTQLEGEAPGIMAAVALAD